MQSEIFDVKLIQEIKKYSQTFVASNVNIVLCKINVAHNRVLKFGKNIDWCVLITNREAVAVLCSVVKHAGSG